MSRYLNPPVKKKSLTKEQVLEIRKRLSDGKKTSNQIADEFNISTTTLNNIQKFRTHKDVV